MSGQRPVASALVFNAIDHGLRIDPGSNLVGPMTSPFVIWLLTMSHIRFGQPSFV